jgi:hypothetical protein
VWLEESGEESGHRRSIAREISVMVLKISSHTINASSSGETE